MSQWQGQEQFPIYLDKCKIARRIHAIANISCFSLLPTNFAWPETCALNRMQVSSNDIRPNKKSATQRKQAVLHGRHEEQYDGRKCFLCDLTRRLPF